NVQSNDTIIYTITAQGTMWDEDLEITTDEDLEQSSYSVKGTTEHDLYGWNFVRNPPEQGYPVFAFAKYKFECNHNSTYFYINFTDDRHCKTYPDTVAWHPDVRITYDASAETYTWCNNNPGPCSENTITNGSTINIWEMKDSATQSTAGFRPTDPTNLALTNSGGHPLLNWERCEPRGSAKYIVYRGSGAITSSISDTNYIDEDVIIGAGQTITYKVRAVSGDGSKYSANFSNTVSTQGNFWKIGVGGSPTEDSFALLPAWPNPFNPTTTIEFALPQSGYVTLKVYNPLGEEVATLVEAEHADGRYKATWDASGVPSGVYFYRLTAGGYVHTKKMILMR
ncbi:MAG: T9SS type A sorting domain-containing protein, partial [Bacteroidota bacterium]